MKRHLIIILAMGLLGLGCSTKPDSFSQYFYTEKNIQFLVEQGQSYWEKRVNPEEAEMARLFLSKAYNLDPNNGEVSALYSRACHFMGYYIEDDPVKSDSLFLEGMKTAWDFILATNAYQEGFALTDGDSIAKMIGGIENTPQDMIPVLYWWMANYSRFLVTKSVMERLAQRDIIETALHRILALNPSFFYHGANRIFGGIFARLPGVDLNHSENNFEKSITGSPNYLGTFVLRAQYLHTKSGDREQFVKDLQFVLNADPTLIPEVSPENLIEQEKARKLLEKEEFLFE
ncbi:MAG: TRAP transporter TatT component family protein [Candidatus Marinimicrobia bacterium]|nr:TRAP transporter TatT component family protein [Candidatus Neomarinimicrobiota bacterium]